jgi:hypothetical protein
MEKAPSGKMFMHQVPENPKFRLRRERQPNGLKL